MEKTDCFGLDCVPSVDRAPSMKAKNWLQHIKKISSCENIQSILHFSFAGESIGAETSQRIVLVPYLEFMVGRKQERESFMFRQNHQENTSECKARIFHFLP